MSSEPVVPLNNAEKENEDVASATENKLRREGRQPTSSTDRMLEPEYKDSRPLGELPVPPAETQTKHPVRLRETAETVGAAVGKAVNTARELPKRLAEMKQRFTLIRGRTREDAASAAAELGENAKQRATQARVRIQHYAHEYPIQFIVGVGGVCFVVGMLLRMWRSTRHG